MQIFVLPGSRYDWIDDIVSQATTDLSSHLVEKPRIKVCESIR